MKISKHNELPTSFKGFMIPKYYINKPTMATLCIDAKCDNSYMSLVNCTKCAVFPLNKIGYTKEEKEELLLLVQSIYKKYNK